LQTTLLGLGIAVILALVTALVGPLLIDWGGYRSLFEQEASRLTGVQTRVTGTIDARLLPSPRLTLNGVDIGSGADTLHARTLTVEFALAPLLRAEWRATDVQIAGPQVTLRLDENGRLRSPGIALAFNPDALTIERLGIVDGQVTLIDAANGSNVTLDRLWFNGDARSLAGPIKGEGAVRVGGELYPFRLSTGRYSDEAGTRIQLHVDPVAHPLSVEVSGNLTLGDGEPRFEGTVNMARPVGIGVRGSTQPGQTVTQPWRATGKLKASAESALLEQIEFVYGTEEQGLRLTGVADFKFGKSPRFDGLVSGRQIDLDRTLAPADGSRPLPAAIVRQLVALGGGAFRPTFPMQIGIGIDQVTLGANSVQNVRGDITSDAGGWNLERFEFRAPGFTQVRLSGNVTVAENDVTFTGPAEIDSTDPKTLAAWLEGRTEPAQAELRPLSLRGEVTLGSERIAVERLRAEFDRKAVAGRLAIVLAAANRPARLDAELNAPELDIDAALAFGKALVAGSKAERPRDMTIAADIGRATIGGFVARNTSARLKVDGGGLQIDKLSVADLGGAAFSASGRIDTATPSPQGSIRVDLTAPDMRPVMAVVARFAPDTAASLAPVAPRMAPAKLQARLTLDGAAPAAKGGASLAKFGIDGSLGRVRVALNGDAAVDGVALTVGDVRLDGKFDADDGRALVEMLGLQTVVAAAAGPGALTLTASGPSRGDMRVESRLTAGGLEASVSGTAKPFAETAAASLRATIVRANMAPLGGVGRPALPVTGSLRFVLAGKEMTFADVSGTAGAAALRGRLGVTLGAPRRLQGEVEADTVDGAAVLAAAIGFPAAAANGSDGAWVWSPEPFGDGAFGDMTGEVALRFGRVDFAPRVTARQFRATLHLDRNELAFDNVAGEVAGGRLGGRLAFVSADEGLKVQSTLSLAGADAASLLPASARPPVTGAFSISASLEGAGLSPVALFGSLKGSGTLGVANAQFAGLDPRAFDVVTRAVDLGLPVDAARITSVVSRGLDSGRLDVTRAEGAFTVSAGQMRMAEAATEARDAALAMNGRFDLTSGSLDGRLVLSGSAAAAGNRPDIYMSLKGPLAGVSRSIDVSALSGWLTLRAVENQAKKLRAAEEAAAQRAAEDEARLKAIAAAAEAARRKAAEDAREKAAAEAARQRAAEEAARQKAAAEAERQRAIEAARPPAAPALPPPLDIRPVPAPAGASVGPQN